MNEDIKRIDIKDFRELGYLQELNRRFLHPLGLAIEVIVNEDGTERLGGIWDYRTDLEGIQFDIKNSSGERRKKFLDKLHYIDAQIGIRQEARTKALGFFIEPIENIADNEDK
jgi:hypothetical protein